LEAGVVVIAGVHVSGLALARESLVSNLHLQLHFFVYLLTQFLTYLHASISSHDRIGPTPLQPAILKPSHLQLPFPCLYINCFLVASLITIVRQRYVLADIAQAAKDEYELRNTLGIDYDGPEANWILSRSLSRWQAALCLAKSIPGFPESSFKLEGLLSQIPSLPDDIPSGSTWIEGYSTWKNSDAKCPLVDKTDKTRRYNLRSQHPTTHTISTSDNFRVWEENQYWYCSTRAGLGIILSASLAERQQLSLRYAPLDSPSDQ
jgi:hypothetical protein